MPPCLTVRAGNDPGATTAANLVISQVYGGGGNASATYTNDFIEIFNRGTTIRRFLSNAILGTIRWQRRAISRPTRPISLRGIILPGHYFLIREASEGAAGVRVAGS